MVATGEETQAQIERILQSATFRNTEALKRLLRYLADKSLAGEADQIKEYTLAVDALGKSPSYDPRQDSQVRIQVGRLRQKLAEYYQTEGQHDTVVVTLPKGRFVLQAAPSSRPEREVRDPVSTATRSNAAAQSRRIVLAIAAALIFCVAWAIYTTIQLRNERKTEASRAQWTADMDDLWRPLINSRRPLLISVSSPLFVGLQGSGLFRDRSANTWEEALKSPAVAAVRKGLHNPQIVSRYYYTGFGNMEAIFQLGKLFAGKDLHVSIVKSQDLSWRELTDNNVILLGSLERFAEQTPNMPAELDLALRETSIPPDPADDPAGGPEDGETLATVTFRPGLLNRGYVVSFSSRRGPGTIGAVRWFTEPDDVRTLVSKLRNSSGQLPPYFQLVLKVKYKASVPTAVTYVTHNELKPASSSVKQ